MKQTWLSKNQYIFFFVFLAVIILWKMLLPGYILTTDMIFGPHYPVPQEATIHSLPYHYLLFVLHKIIDGSIIQKAMLVFVLGVAGVAMYKTVPVKSEYAKYFAGILYVINPFVYSRFFAGHLTILLGYALLPFCIKSILKLFSKKDNSLKAALKVVLWLTIIGIFSEHILYISLFVLGVTFVSHLITKLNEWKFHLKQFGKTLIIFLIANLWWIFTYFTDSPIKDFDASHYDTFRTAADQTFGVIFNVVAMYGFWWESAPQGDFIIWPKNIFAGWYIVFAFIFAIILYGLITAFKNKKTRFITGLFIVFAIFSVIFSAGGQLLYDYVPFFNGFRDSQKWSSLLIVCYCYGGAFALANIIQNKKTFKTKAILFTTCALVLLYTFPMLGGFSGQLKPVKYPESWHETNEIINKASRKDDVQNERILFLPWHMYMSFEFNNNRLIRIPAPHFFDASVLIGDNMEVGNLYSTSMNPESKKIETFIINDNKSDGDLKKLLDELDIRYIMYVSDTEKIEDIDYSFLFKSKHLKQIFHEENVFLLEVNQGEL